MAEQLVRNFRFLVKLRKSPEAQAGEAPTGVTSVAEDSANGAALTNGAFQEVSGLEVAMDVQEYLEGGRNDGVIRRAGRARYLPITLKRGMFYSGEKNSTAVKLNKALWSWLQSITAGQRPIPRYDGVIEVLGKGEQVVASWEFERGLPSRVRGPELNAKTGEIAIEELQIAHEGLRLV
jgi:phage tail-like protein